ncbi:hypothetical protein [Rhizobium straminoryzae]|uniref:Uncharacterized protein n=1 Tax=Rhizobium straminoryzae TaxID=1387186 RepID=A0A549T6E5_9HYPH|nr:hypothetical protein [Rhizobium straminoryzae]TRL37448.1 hypothetical protein FNA46_15175 [Rhizobium straminoryzae]
MQRQTSIELLDEEMTAMLNMLNYFGYALSEGECSTLSGMDQDAVQALFRRLEKLANRNGTDRKPR